jgi:hypothetical protein
MWKSWKNGFNFPQAILWVLTQCLVLLGFLSIFSLAQANIKSKEEIKSIVDHACERYEFDNCKLVHAIVHRESSYASPKVMDTNDKYSYGPMQIQCPTARDMGLKFSCEQLHFNPLIGIRFGIKYLRHQLDRYNGDIEDAVSAYNAGTAFRCQTNRYNPENGRLICYAGERVNEYYTWMVMRHYNYLKSKETFNANR